MWTPARASEAARKRTYRQCLSYLQFCLPMSDQDSNPRPDLGKRLQPVLVHNVRRNRSSRVFDLAVCVAQVLSAPRFVNVPAMTNSVGTAPDLADLEQVRRLATKIGRYGRLDALVSNAGIGTVVAGGGKRQESVQGHELRFAVNYLAVYLLTRRCGERAASRDLHADQDRGESGEQHRRRCPRHSPADHRPGAPIGDGRCYNGLRDARAHPQAYDPRDRAQLRELSERLTEG